MTKEDKFTSIKVTEKCDLFDFTGSILISIILVLKCNNVII